MMRRRVDLRSQPVDRVSSFLGGSLIVTGAVVLLLLGMWMLQGSSSLVASPIPPVDFGGASGGQVNQLDMQPEIGTVSGLDLQPVSLESNLQAIVEVASEVGASTTGLVDVGGTGSGQDPRSVEDGNGKGGGSGALDGERQRWKLKFEAASAKEYAKQLDLLGIELACIGGGIPVIEYASNFLNDVPTRRDGASADEERMFFAWYGDGRLQEFERSLLQAAGIETQGRIALKFISPELQRRMQQLELEAATKEGNQLEDIHSTVFRVSLNGDEAGISVERQLLIP